MPQGGDDDICIDYIRVGTQQSNGKYLLRWATSERFWLSGYRGNCWGEDTGRGGYPCYQEKSTKEDGFQMAVYAISRV